MKNQQENRASEAFIARVASTDASVLILGESGTGKEVMARALHQRSNRATGPFVAINCALLSETLLESELFGHERGSFTGAVEQKKGKFELAAGGTLFLDEVGELAPSLQPKILRVLQEREIERVGGTRPIRVDIRLLAATNRDLHAAVRAGHFRRDLYHRLKVVAVQIPPLRERREEIVELARHFLARYAAETRRAVRGISPEAESLLLNYHWPGNVRELENAVHAAILMASGDVLGPKDFPDEVFESQPTPLDTAGKTYYEMIREFKCQLFERVALLCDGEHKEIAATLGLHPNSVHRFMKALKLAHLLK